MVDPEIARLNAGFSELVAEANDSIHGATAIDGEMIQTADYRFNKTFAHRCSLNTLRRLPRYLCDSVLSSQLPVSFVTWDHYSYWAWTAAVASALHPQSMTLHRILDDSDTSNPESPLSEYMPIIKDYFTMVNLILFPVRQSQLDDRVQTFVSSMNPNVDGVEGSTVLGFAGTNGFSILDGLLTHHCDRLHPDEGIRDKDSIEDSWRSDGELKSPPSLRGKLWLWQKYNEEIFEEVQQTLAEIDDISRDEYDIEHLFKRIESVERSEWEDLSDGDIRRESFFWMLGQQRNKHLHGLHSTRIIGPLVMNLCSLIIWDMVDAELYQDIRKALFQGEINPQGMNHRRLMNHSISTPFDESILPGDVPFGPGNDDPQPDMFYPLFPDEEADLVQNERELLDQ